MSIIRKPFGFGASEVEDMTVSLTANGQSTSGAAANTFSSIAIGDADATRSVILCVQAMYADGQRTVTATVDGSAMTQAAYVGSSDGQDSAIFYKAFPSGTTAEFIVTWSGAINTNGMGMTVYKVTNLGSEKDSGGESGAGGTNPFTDSIAVTAGGAAIAISGNNDGPSVGTCTWTNLTEDVDVKINTYYAYSGASAAISSTSASLAITATWTGSPDNGAISMASFDKG